MIFIRTVAEEAAALAGLSLFLSMLVIWSAIACGA
jgi:hypothetical protein